MPKFFVKSGDIVDDQIINLVGDNVKHIRKVLRKNVGDEVILCDRDNERNYLCEIQEMDNEKIVTRIKEEIIENKESNLCITVFQGLPKFEKMELIIQKTTELGVTKIVPTIMKRCVVKLNEKEKEKKKLRWKKIAEMAAKQSGRNRIPEIDNFINIKKLCENIKKYDIVIVAYENEDRNSIKTEVKKLNLQKKRLNIAVVIGPEGGFEPIEIEEMSRNGAKIVSLGKRILRTETVALVMTSILMYELGDLN